MISDLVLTALYLGCSVYAYLRGFRAVFIIIALMLALVFQYGLGFSLIAKITIGAIFLLYFVLPDLRGALYGESLHDMEEEGEPIHPRYRKQKDHRGFSEEEKQSAQDAVFEDLQNFSKARKQKKKPSTEA